MPQVVPLSEETHQTFDFAVADGTETLSLFAWWNALDDAWYLSVRTTDSAVTGMQRMTAGQWLLPHRNWFQGGDFYVLSAEDPRSRNSFLGPARLLWYEGYELDELADALD